MAVPPRGPARRTATIDINFDLNSIWVFEPESPTNAVISADEWHPRSEQFAPYRRECAAVWHLEGKVGDPDSTAQRLNGPGADFLKRQRVMFAPD